MPAIGKVLGGVILFFAALILYFSYRDVTPFLSEKIEDAPARLASLWKRDIIELAGAKKLPEAFFRAKEIRFTYGSETAENWISKIEVRPIQPNPTGEHRLDVFVDHWRDNKEYGVVLQYQLVDLKTGNMIWELGRTLRLGTLTEEEISQLEKPNVTRSAAPATNEQKTAPSK